MNKFKVTRVDKLGAICAFKPKEIQVLGEVYDSVPEDKREDFEVVLNQTKAAYDAKVDAVKKAGEKPKAVALKSEAIMEVLNPWLGKMGLADQGKKEPTKRVVSRNPRIPDESEKVTIPDHLLDRDKVASIYDNFPSDMLSDEMPEADKVDLTDDIFDGEEDMFGADVMVTDLDAHGVSFEDEDGATVTGDIFGGMDFDFDNLME